MGNHLPLYKPQVKRKKKLVNDIRAFLLRLAINCNVNAVPVDSGQLKILIKQSNQFVMLLIELFDYLHLIYKARNLGEKLVYKIEMIFFNIKDMGELLLVILRNVFLGQQFFTDRGNEFKSVFMMYQKGVSDIQQSFAAVIQYTVTIISLVHPKTDLMHATNNTIQKTMDDIYRQLLLLINMFENFQEMMQSTKKMFYEVLEEIYTLTLFKIIAVGVIAFLIFTCALLLKLTTIWVIMLSALCAFTEWHIATNLITNCSSKQLYEVFSAYDAKANTRKYSGRIIPQDWFSGSNEVVASKEEGLADQSGR